MMLILLIRDRKSEGNFEKSIKKGVSEMFKVFSLFAIVILFLSSSAFAVVGQAEGFSINAFNGVGRVGAAGRAEGGNMVMVGHSQEAHVPYRGGAAIQDETGILTQSASSVGTGGATFISQDASVKGLQDQLIAGYRGSLIKEGQSLNLNLGQEVHKFSGIGGAVGAQGFVGGQNQIAASPGQFSAESQFVGAVQYAAVYGGPCSSAFVDNNLDVKMDQGHTVVGRSAPPRPCPPRYDP